MADVLLTHSYHLPYDPKQVRKMQPYPPLGTLFAATALRAQNISVAVFDTMLQDPVTGFPQALVQERPIIVAIYEDDFNFLSKMCLTRMREVTWQLARDAHEAGAIVIAHGSDASDHAEMYLHNAVDYVLLGEAEQTLVELCSAILTRSSIETIPGLVSFDAAGNLVRNSGTSPKNASWSTLPNPARDLIDLQPYRQAWATSHGLFSTSVVASRGCPYRCNWCAKPISGNKFQIRPPEMVAAEIRELKEVHGVQHIWFGDDVFALNQHWTQQFASTIEAMQCVIPFKIQSRSDLMTNATVEALRRAGCTEVWMGVESGSQRVLNAMDKGLKVSQVKTARERLRDSGIRACYFLQFGYPGEQWDDIQQTLALVRSTRPDDIGVSISYPLPGTPFYERVRDQIGPKRNWTDSDDLCVMFKATYTNEFYLCLRDALHAEVDSWRDTGATRDGVELSLLWKRVLELERVTRNNDTTAFTRREIATRANSTQEFVPLQALTTTARNI